MTGAELGRCVVTGAAGFVGSHLAERLHAVGATVIAVDSYSDYYDRERKLANLSTLTGAERFELHELDLASDDLAPLVAGADVLFHQAGQPGVRSSWGDDFAVYLRANVLATQRLLEAARASPRLRRFVYASSSSVYGDAEELPTTERALPRPVSPYGVTKLAGEHLCGLYGKLGVPTVSLRYFTVYGPRQRPDMAFSKFINALLAGEEIVVHGDGEQTRDVTYVTDVVNANLAAADPARALAPGAVYNIGGGTRTSVNHVLRVLERATGRPLRLRYHAQPAGEARDTHADCTSARHDLGFSPGTSLEDGLAAQVRWIERGSGR
ncbi:MAG TPA: NAD-dependent epimerase/dehydratase family protein [Candidatus Dormibacteraeota bacterium]|nr:NAD-dependent epimerase/dehydratase family protein [Candidatus Dormibacteraeota bacterium]